MKKNQYPKSSVQYLSQLPKEERRRLVLENKTTAGPLAKLMYKHPIWFAIAEVLILLAFFIGCWTCIQS